MVTAGSKYSKETRDDPLAVKSAFKLPTCQFKNPSAFF